MAKVSEVAICNYALALLGETPIISLDDDSKPAALCKAMYPIVRDASLEAHNWTFATKWYDLPMVPEPALGEYRNRFPLPAEYLRTIFVGSDATHPARHQIEGGDVVTNDQRCLVQMVVQVTDTFKFTPMFVHALAAYLAAELAVPIASSASLQQQMFQLYGVKVGEAVSRDQIQGTSKQIKSTWIKRGRFAGSRLTGPMV